MSTNQSSEPSENTEFNLKHRVTGAAVLLFFGAAFLPWLLGPPSDANKTMPDMLSAEASEFPEEIKGAELSLDGAEVINVEESVYVSKITPLDKGKQATLEKVVPQKAQETAAKTPEVDTKAEEALAAQKAKDKLAADNKKEQAQKAAKEQKLKQQQIAIEDREKKQEADAAAQLKAKLAKEQAAQNDKQNTTTVDVGWIVQVGLFTEKDRAVAFISELKNKGFTASSNVVDTNRGKNTGTRVWLGPFARKANAANEVKRLKSKAGKDGFIRSYP